jgi:hypothetical protein
VACKVWMRWGKLVACCCRAICRVTRRWMHFQLLSLFVVERSVANNPAATIIC